MTVRTPLERAVAEVAPSGTANRNGGNRGIPVKMVFLFTMAHRQTAAIYSGALAGGETIGWALGEGTVSGPRVRGGLRRANRPWHRADGLQVPNAHGVITTDDGAVVFFELSGLGRPPMGAERPEAYGGMTFRTADARYAWLNSIFAVAERRDDGGPEAAVSYDVYECTPGDTR